MVVVKVELWPLGNDAKAKTLGVMKIANDGRLSSQTGGEYGSYWIKIYDRNGELFKSVSLNKFPRKQLSAWDLILRSLNKAKGSKSYPERE